MRCPRVLIAWILSFVIVSVPADQPVSISFCAQRAGRVPGSSSVTTGSSIYRHRGFNLTFLYRDFPRLIAPSWLGALKRGPLRYPFRNDRW